MKKTILFFAGLAFFTFKNQAQTITDIDGNVYNTVTIGTQVWMKENLKVTHYRNGDSILKITDSTVWSNYITGTYYCDYDNAPSNSTIYGKLYNWYSVVDSRNVCPTKWHVPSDDEWTTLINYLGGENVAGGKLKETGTTHWYGINIGADNSSGFTAIPGGYRNSSDGSFSSIGRHALFWSSAWFYGTEGANALSRRLNYYDSCVYRANLGDDKKMGFSVRCVKDPTTQINEIDYQEEIKVYPNPVIDKVYIKYAEKKNLKMQVYNIIGECVLQSNLTNRANMIDISSLTSGMYVIRLTGDYWTTTSKFIKE